MCWPKLIYRSAIFFAVLLFFSFSRSSLLAGTVDMVVARVNSEIVTLSSVQDRFRLISESFYASGNAGQLPLEEELMKNALNSIIEEKLQLQEAKKQGLAVNDESIAKAVDDIKKSNNISDEQLESMLENEGRSIEAYKKTIGNQILISRITRMNVEYSSAVTNSQIKKYYVQHQKEYWKKPKVKVRHILFILEKDAPKNETQLKKNRAKEVLHLVRAGKDFAELARKYSEDVSAHSGGEIGIVEYGMMVREFEEAAFRLKAGEVSEIITTTYGLHIIKCDEVFPGYTKSLNQVKHEIKSLLGAQNKQKAYQKWVKELKENAFIEISLFKDNPGTFSDNADFLERQTAGLTEDNFFEVVESKKAVKSKSRRKAKKPSLSQWELPQDQNAQHYQVIIKKLKDYKKLRDSKKISELEYRKKKKELLRKF